MLSYCNIVSNVWVMVFLFFVEFGKMVLSFLFFSYIFECMVLLIYMVVGLSIYIFVECLYLLQVLFEVCLNIFIVVFCILEKMYD